MTSDHRIAVREAALADAPAIADLLAACHLGRDNLVAPGTRYWLAEAGDALVGVIGLEIGDGASLLRSAAVAESARGRGVGAALVHTCLAAAAAYSPAVYLFSTDAGAYWQRFGFVLAPVDELVAALPDAPQVRRYYELGWLPTEVAWKYMCPAP